MDPSFSCLHHGIHYSAHTGQWFKAVKRSERIGIIITPKTIDSSHALFHED